MTVKLKAPRVRATLETPNEGEYLELDVQTDNRDLVMWDVVRTRKGWPVTSDAPMLWITFLAWHALHREHGPVPDKFEDFQRVCVQVESLNADAEVVSGDEADEAADVFPIPPVHAPA